MQDIEDIARRNGVSRGAADALFQSLVKGGGRAAQFDHPELGGMGQWSGGGMLMIGAMFDHALKARVAALCEDLAPLAVEHASRPDAATGGWWPQEFGAPASAGSQNDARYAVFPQSRRLAIEIDGRVTVYDTGEHRITGVSQQQGSSRDLSFVSQLGTVRVHDLTPVRDASDREVGARSTPAAAATAASHGASGHDPSSYQRAHSEEGRNDAETLHESAPRRGSLRKIDALEAKNDDPLRTLERLHELHGKGVLTEEEFRTKKSELLSRI